MIDFNEEYENIFDLVEENRIDDAIDLISDFAEDRVMSVRNGLGTEDISRWLDYFIPARLISIGGEASRAIAAVTKGARCEAWISLCGRVAAVYPEHLGYIEGLLLETPVLKTEHNPFMEAAKRGRRIAADKAMKQAELYRSILEPEIPTAREWIDTVLPEHIATKAEFGVEEIIVPSSPKVGERGVSDRAVAYAIERYYSNYLDCYYDNAKCRYLVKVKGL